MSARCSRACGTGPSKILNILKRFYRVDKARLRQHGGAGLGIALVPSIVGSHGGDVRVESCSGLGTTFTLRLPLGA
jgi:signal transduction histidine kinase